MSKTHRGLHLSSPKDPVVCPDGCPHCPKSKSPEDCQEQYCTYDVDKETLGDKKYHKQF